MPVSLSSSQFAIIWHRLFRSGYLTKIAVRDEYVDKHLKRYRVFLGLPELPMENERTPLLTTLNSRNENDLGGYLVIYLEAYFVSDNHSHPFHDTSHCGAWACPK
jgi:hypothetical protein